MSESCIIGLDVGPTHSAYCVLNHAGIGRHQWVENHALLTSLRFDARQSAVYVLESPQAQDRPLGKMLRDTIWWAGRIAEALDSQELKWVEAEERDVALWITGNRSASNAALLQSLKDHFGDTEQRPCYECTDGFVPGKHNMKKCPRCKGQKFTKVPGPLKGMNEHERSALGAALWYRLRLNRPTAATA